MAAPYPQYNTYSAPATHTVSTDSNVDYGIISTMIAGIDMDASAALVAVQQETYAITGIHYDYPITLSEPNTYKLLNSFKVEGWGPTGSTLAAGDPLKVVVSDGAAFEEVIKAALDAAKFSVESTFVDDLQSQLRVWLQKDGLVNSVQNLFGSVTVALDTATGAGAMRAGYENVTEDYAEILYTQISNDRLAVYTDTSEEPITSALPLQGGDKITFVFSCNPNMSSFNYTQTDITGSSGAQATAVAGDYAGVMPNITSENRRFALVLTLDGAGKLKCESLGDAAPLALKP